MAGEKETVHTEEGKTFRQIPLGTSVEDNSQDQFPTHNPSRPSGRGIRRAYSSSAKISIPAAPRSNNFRLPLKMPDVQANLSQTKSPKRLLHPSLERIPMQVRFGLNGFLTNVMFMFVYNYAVAQFENVATASTIYSVVYLIFIPIGHACISLLVFGWPEKYIPSLMSNFPIGLTAIALGAALTAYLDTVNFNARVELLLSKNWSYFGFETPSPDQEESGEFYSSLLVLLVTGIWTFVLSVVINAPAEPTDKKEL